ncbi:MAG: fumarylacetoacetate hydrolase family protein [Pseudomonadota bacterium]
MIRNTATSVVLLIIVLVSAVFLAKATSEDPKYNLATFEGEPFVQSIAPRSIALTIAQYVSDDGERVALLVEDYDGEVVTGVDLVELGGVASENPFEALASVDRRNFETDVIRRANRTSVDVARLLPAGPPGMRHIGIGTNFPEHAQEANSDQVFHFPKFGAATPARTSVSAPENSLLDYEVELCMRFDRPIETISDFDAATKGVFLCGDFTDRIALIKLADPDNLDSGFGFSDSKSGPGYFPTGPFLVVPNDWSSFVDDIRMMTHLNDAPRQDARGREMTLDFRQLTEQAIADISIERFFYRGAFYKLAPNGRLEADMTLMSGTSEGVIFTPPQRHDYIDIVIAYVLAGGPLTGKSLTDFGADVFIKNEIASGHFLQPGDVVGYEATYLGDIRVTVAP